MELSIERNVTLPRARKLARLGLLFGGAERRSAATWTERLQTRLGRLSDAVGTLSGGNQQKVVLAKWLSTGPQLLIVDEPTRGIDVGTKAEVHRLMSSLAADGLAVVMVSSELPEVLGMADRIVVLREGRVTATLGRTEATEETILAAAMGATSATGPTGKTSAGTGGTGTNATGANGTGTNGTGTSGAGTSGQSGDPL
jgi:rhamnose transport system ATP-binding protein